MAAAQPELAVSALQTISQRLNGLRANIKPFTGTSDIEDWLDDFHNYAKFTGQTSEDEQFNCLVNYLEGDAKSWYRIHSGTLKDFDGLQAKLIQRFAPSPSAKFQTKIDIYNSSQESGETFIEYLERIQILARRLNVSENEVLNIVVAGAKSDIKPYLLMKEPANIEELISLPIVRDEQLLLNNVIGSDTVQSLYERFSTLQQRIGSLAPERRDREETKDAKQPPNISCSLISRRRRSCSPRAGPPPGSRRPPAAYRRRPHSASPRRPRACSVPARRPRYPSMHPAAPLPGPRDQCPPPASRQQRLCSKCGRMCNGNTKCYARHKRCYKCRKYNHFSRCCRALSISDNIRPQ